MTNPESRTMIPQELKSGDPLEANWLNSLVRAIVARTINAGPGLLKTQTPAGTTLSLAPQRRGGAAGGGTETDFAWKVTATPIGDGSTASIAMVDGAILLLNGADGAVHGTRTYSGTTASASGWLYFTYVLGSAPGSVAFAASLPTAAVPIAEITKTQNGGWKVVQYMAGTFSYVNAVAEEV